MSRVLTFADGFSSATVPQDSTYQETYPISNNATNGELFTLVGSAFFEYELKRKDSLDSKCQTGSITINEKDGVFSVSFGNYSGDTMVVEEIVNDFETVISIDEVTGVLSYDTGAMGGDDYEGTLKMSIMRIL